MRHNPGAGHEWLYKLEGSHLSSSSRSLVDKMQAAFKQNELPSLWLTFYFLMDIRNSFSDPLEQGEITLECALIIYQLGDLNKSIQLLNDAEKLYGENKHYLAVIRWMMGCIQWDLPDGRAQAYESWSQCLRLFSLLQSCSINQEHARWYGSVIQEIRDALEKELNQNQGRPWAENTPDPTTNAAFESPQESPGNPRAKANAEVNSLLLQLFQVVEKIPAGGFGPVGFRPLSIGEVDIDRVIIGGEYHRMVNLRGSSKVLSLPANKYVVVRITGDSMNKPGKLEEEAVDIGDYVLLRLQETADDGDMVAAEIIDVDSSATLKRFRVVQAGLKYSLEPQSTNPDHLPREFTAIDEGFHIRGVALAAFKPIKSTHENEPNHP